ncbi:MAG: diguanylate cyclase [Candidatus Omnitrophota bacterium]
MRLGTGALAVLIVGGFCSFLSLENYIRANRQTVQARYCVQKIDSVLTMAVESDTAVLSYVLSGNSLYLGSYKNSYYFISRDLTNLTVFLEPDPFLGPQLLKLKNLVIQKFSEHKRIAQVRRNRGLEAAKKALETGPTFELTEKIRSVIGVLRQNQGKVVNLRFLEERTAERTAVYTVVIANLLAFLLTALTILILFRNINARFRAEEKLKEAHRKSKVWVEDLERQNKEYAILGETVDALQSCVTLQEACRVISHSCQKLFPGMQGALYLINETKSLVELAAEWNGPLTGESVFQFDDCWALRRGRSYEVSDPTAQDPCNHVSGVTFDGYLCIPMMGQGAALGFFHFRYLKENLASDILTTGALTESKRNLVLAFAEQAALALANLKLRQTLHYQSMRDPLTNLFNRRHLEEVLERELRRSARSKKPLGVLMLDIDYFKKFNDSHGHDAGDQLLVELAQQLRRVIRDYDVPCRYGGEEFAVLLPEATLEAAHKKAEQLRKSVKHLQLQYKGKLLDPVTLSIGVAVYPTHGESLESLFRAADCALYQAKGEGRDRVVLAETP